MFEAGRTGGDFFKMKFFFRIVKKLVIFVTLEVVCQNADVQLVVKRYIFLFISYFQKHLPSTLGHLLHLRNQFGCTQKPGGRCLARGQHLVEGRRTSFVKKKNKKKRSNINNLAGLKLKKSCSNSIVLYMFFSLYLLHILSIVR